MVTCAGEILSNLLLARQLPGQAPRGHSNQIECGESVCWSGSMKTISVVRPHARLSEAATWHKKRVQTVMVKALLK